MRRQRHTICINLYAIDSNGSAAGSPDAVVAVADGRVAIGVPACRMVCEECGIFPIKGFIISRLVVHRAGAGSIGQ